MDTNDNFFLIAKDLFKNTDMLYVSCPITTGYRFILWYMCKGIRLKIGSKEYIESKKLTVIDPNIKIAKFIIKDIRTSTKMAVIDPSDLEGASLNWKQQQYYDFWDRVLRDLVNEVIFLDGWEYSIGCCIEYWSALQYDLPIMSQDMKIMPVHEACVKMAESIKKYESCNLYLESDKIKKILGLVLCH